MEIFHPKKIKNGAFFHKNPLHHVALDFFVFVLVAAEPKFTPKNKNHLLGDLAHIHKCREASFNGNKGPMRWSHIQAPFLLSPGPRALHGIKTTAVKYLPLYPEGTFQIPPGCHGKRQKDHLQEFAKMWWPN